MRFILPVTVALFFAPLIWASLRRPVLGLGLLIALLPALHQSRRLFGDAGMLFPSLETIAVIVVWLCAQAMEVASDKVASAPRHSSLATGHLPLAPTASGIVPAVLFLSAGLISSLTARDPALSFRILLAGGLAPLLCFSIAHRYVRDQQELRPVLLGVFALALQTALYTVVTFSRRQGMGYTGLEMYVWLYTKASVLDLFTVPSVAVATNIVAIPLAAWYWNHGGSQRRPVGAAVLVGTLLSIALSLSRGSWLAGAVAIVGSLPLWFRRVRLSGVFIAIAVIVVLYATGIADLVRGGILYRLVGQQLSLSSQDPRVANYVLAMGSASRFVVSGLGLGQYVDIYALYPDAVAAQIPPLWFAHSIFLTLIPEIGLIGAAAFAYLFLMTIVRSFRLYRRGLSSERAALSYALCVGVVSYLVSASTAGAHLIAYLLTSETRQTYFVAPALIVAFSALGAISGLGKGLGTGDSSPARAAVAQPHCEPQAPSSES
jgi:O-antigen ligase